MATALALAPDGKRLYVCNRFDHNVSVIDLEGANSLRECRWCGTGGSGGLPDGSEVWVAIFCRQGPPTVTGCLRRLRLSP